MQTVSLGLVTDTAGSATRLTTDTTIRCCAIRFRSRNANTNLVNVGLNGFTAGGAGMIGEVLKPSGYSDELMIGDMDGDNLIYPADYAVKPVTNGEGVYVTYYVR
jgi:hypothetical protein